MYRTQQIQHAIAMRVAGSLLPFLLPATEAVIVIAVFAIIRFYRILHPFICLTAISTTVVSIVALQAALRFANVLISNSKTYKDAHKLRNALTQTFLDRKHFLSYRPLEWVIGKSFRIQKDTFPKILQNVILDTVVSLLVYFR